MLKKFIFLLNPRDRKHTGLILIMMLIMALLDMIGVASILPFIAVLTNPDIIYTNIFLNQTFEVFKIFGIQNNEEFLFSLGIIVFIILVISLIFKAFVTYLQTKFIQMLEYTIGKRLVEGYLRQPYSWFLDRHSADIGKNVLSEVNTVVGAGLNPLLRLISNAMVAIAILILLIIADTKLALIVAFTLGGSYAIIFKLSRNYLDKIGKESLNNNQLRFTAIIEAFGAAKEIKIGGLEEIFIKRFSDASKIIASNTASSSVIGQLPRFALEIIAFGGVMLIVLYLMTEKGNLNYIIPIISLYVFATYRLMPSLQQIYICFTQLTFIQPSLDTLCDDLKNLKPFQPNQKNETIPFNNTIKLNNIFYSYPNASRTALKDITLNIKSKTSVGLVGVTGCGKTTTIDIILGLLEPQLGTLEVDGKIITKKNSKAWQRSIGYVPQNIFLSDDTVAANIAFGINTKDINQKIIEKVSKIANLHNFVNSELPNKYQTKIGERGVRLSGGQRQRIGIARALYNNPKLLILDEATNALDDQTEKAVMEAVNNLNKNLTIIAHRLNTLKDCDNIFHLENGKLVSK